MGRQRKGARPGAPAARPSLRICASSSPDRPMRPPASPREYARSRGCASGRPDPARKVLDFKRQNFGAFSNLTSNDSKAAHA